MLRIVRQALIGCFLLLISLPTPALSADWTPDQHDTLTRVSAYLNTIQTLQARFTQIATDGSFAEGDVYLERPGNARFDYDHSQTSIIANGIWLGIWDRELEYVDRMPLWDSPLSVLLEEETDLTRDDKTLGIEDIVQQQNIIRLTVYDKDSPENGTLTLVFEDAPMILRRWDTVDATGQTTTVSIYNVETGMPLARDLFRIPNI